MSTITEYDFKIYQWSANQNVYIYILFHTKVVY